MTTGLVLSGGGARGAAHIGVLAMLEEMAIKPQMVAGVSAGAVIGALHAAGVPARDILAILKGQSYLSLKSLSFGGAGLFNMNNLRSLLLKAIGHDDFSSLQASLHLVATDMITGEKIVLNEGSITTAVMASASVPVVYEPISFSGRMLADGGLKDNFPVSLLRTHCEVVIGCHVNKLSKVADVSSMSKFTLIDRAFHMAIAADTARSAQHCDVLIEPDLSMFGMFQMKDADKIYEAGYRAARDSAADIERLFAAR